MINARDEDDDEDNIVSSADAAVSAAKVDRWTCVVMTYLVAIFIGIPVGAIGGSVLFAFINPNAPKAGGSDIWTVPLFSAFIGFMACRLLFGKLWIQKSETKKAQIEKLKTEWSSIQNMDERKKLEGKMFSLAYGKMGTKNQEVVQRVQKLKTDLAAAKTPEERKKLQDDMEDELLTKGSGKQLAASASILFVVCVASIAAMQFFIHPLRYFESFILVELISLPIAATVLFTFIQKNPSWPYPAQSKSAKQNNNQPQKPVSALDGRRIVGFLAITLLCASLGLALNQWLDFSQADTQAFAILEKHISHSRKWGDSYHIKIQSPVASPIAALDFGGQEDIKIHEADYNRVVPGQTTITLSIAKGVFHLPWYSSAYSISDK